MVLCATGVEYNIFTRSDEHLFGVLGILYECETNRKYTHIIFHMDKFVNEMKMSMRTGNIKMYYEQSYYYGTQSV